MGALLCSSWHFHQKGLCRGSGNIVGVVVVKMRGLSSASTVCLLGSLAARSGSPLPASPLVPSSLVASKCLQFRPLLLDLWPCLNSSRCVYSHPSPAWHVVLGSNPLRLQEGFEKPCCLGKVADDRRQASGFYARGKVSPVWGGRK